jgi:hypothetical protein
MAAEGLVMAFDDDNSVIEVIAGAVPHFVTG